MQNSFLQSKDGKLIIDQAQLTMYAVAAVIIIILIIIIVVALKRRKKDFIKTIPTNIKDGE